MTEPEWTKDLIDMPAKKYKNVKIKGDSNMKVIKVNTKRSKAKEVYLKARTQHREALKKLRGEKKDLARDMKRHKLLIKQAKTIYKLESM